MTRLPYIDPDEASPPVADALAKLPPLNLFRLLAQAETAFRPWLRFGGALLGELELDPVLRELAILHVARLCGSEYESVQHRSIALEVGATESQIEAVVSGEHAGLGEEERTVLAFSGEAVLEFRASPSALEEVQRFLSPRQVVELLLVIGHYVSVARIAETVDLDLDEAARLRVSGDPS